MAAFEKIVTSEGHFVDSACVLAVCMDTNPSVVTKLKDRGSLQTIGVVTDVGLFCHTLAERVTAAC